MGYIEFDKQQLINLEFSLSRELLRTNSAGSYASTTIIGCNTRKYHGLLVTLQPKIDQLHHVILSNLDLTIIQQNTEFNLGIHRYENNRYEPGGHKYAREFVADPIPKLTYRVGGVILSYEMVFTGDEDRILLRYTLEDAHSPTKLRFKPLVAFRNVHSLSKANPAANSGFRDIRNGISLKLYEPYDPVYLQFSRKPSYHHHPVWYYNVEYAKEKTRGYDYQEDLFCPGYFEADLKKGESIIFTAGFTDVGLKKLNTLFENEVNSRIPRDSFINCLRNSAQQFFMRHDHKMELIAGYHWFTVHGRDTFVALPGLTLTENNPSLFLKVTDTMVGYMEGPFFPANRIAGRYVYNAVDASLWFFWALQQYVQFTGDYETIWSKYGKIMTLILESFRTGTRYSIYMLENGLLSAGSENDSLTWMNTRINDKPVINRNGLAVEVNALWYNAIRFYLETRDHTGHRKGSADWFDIAARIETSFVKTFWNEELGMMADVVRGDFIDYTVRPNQIFATSLPFSPVSDEIKYRVLNVVQQELLTSRGIRTLTPKNPNFIGIYKGNIYARDQAYHQGCAFPWLLGHFADGYLKIHGKAGYIFIKNLLDGFKGEMTENGIGTISELYYGNPPHRGKGAISQAWSVAELLRVNYLLNEYLKQSNQNK